MARALNYSRSKAPAPKAAKTMVSMELTDEQKIDRIYPMTVEPETYPYGLRISLQDPQMEKLGIDVDTLKEGQLIDLRGMARVKSITKTDTNGTRCCHCELQIEDMRVELEDSE